MGRPSALDLMSYTTEEGSYLQVTEKNGQFYLTWYVVHCDKTEATPGFIVGRFGCRFEENDPPCLPPDDDDEEQQAYAVYKTVRALAQGTDLDGCYFSTMSGAQNAMKAANAALREVEEGQ